MPTGRPRDGSVDTRVLAATAALLREKGYAGLRIDDVVVASGVAKTTIYRRWPSLVHLVVASMAELVGDRTVPRTGDPVADLRTAAAIGLRSLDRVGPSLASLASDIAHHANSDPDLRAAYRRGVIDPYRDAVVDIVRHGQAVGVFQSAIDPAVAADQLIGPAVYRAVLLHEPLPTDEADAVVDLILGGILS